MKKIWIWLSSLFAIVLGLFFVERSKRKKAEAELENASYNANDQILSSKQKDNEDKIASEKQKLEELRKQHDQDVKENQKDLTPQQVEEYWKRKGKPSNNN